jgi:hypothetical protein
MEGVMVRVFALVCLLTFGAAGMAAADCVYVEGTVERHYSPGSLTCQLRQVRECAGNSWVVPASGPQRCGGPSNKTLRIVTARAVEYIPGQPEITRATETITDNFAGICDGKQECAFVPKLKFARGGLTYRLYMAYRCVDDQGNKDDFPEMEYKIDDLLRLDCK